MTITDLLRRATTQLVKSPTPRLDAEVLLMHVCGLTRAQLISRGDTHLLEVQQSQYDAVLSRRARGEPVAYITGHREFWSIDMEVSTDVLIPRPETELLVETALAVIPENADWKIADLGTGSGAVALALALERPHCRITGVDLSEAAIRIARRNAAKSGSTKLEFQIGDWNQPMGPHQFNMIVSNPPYIAVDDPHLLEGDVRHEPRLALVSGNDGLDAIRQIAVRGPEILVRGGYLIVEHGYNQRESVDQIFGSAGFQEIRCLTDLGGRDRVTLCRARA